ncbi:hypothetical protein KR100_00630 [Synechococcus sp. KORDI-100]|uniref:hypothetical protein n=1 Tax=Synechococcus sp. KORDI-100 TaxID=1280380 RepID=UPI0004E05980|nr:hypothetical protein [Synechococcus sp. KORDI-100]AII41913.1 hypothetical protein KR100_00630 [Synechococcus sp. KORDI-100]
MFFAALLSSAILALVLMASEFIGSVVCWSLPEAWFAVSSGVSLSAVGFSDHEIGLGSSKAKYVSTDTLWLSVLAPMNIVTQRDVAILQSLRKRYQKALELDDRDATQQLFKEATYLGIGLQQLVGGY